MARRPYTQSLYDRLVEGFREKPGNASHAARKAGCERQAAKRAWELGWPSRSWAPPIKEYLAQEQEKVRAARAIAMEEKIRVDQEQRDKARNDAVEAQKQEALASQSTRVNAIGLNNMVSRIIGPFLGVVQTLADEIKAGQHKFTPKEVTSFMRQFSYIVRQSAESSRLALEIERLRVGDPTDFFKADTDPELNTEDTVSHLMGISRTLQRAKGMSQEAATNLIVDGGNGVYPDEEDGPLGQVH